MCLRASSWRWAARTGGTDGFGAYSHRDADENQRSCDGRGGLRAAVFSALDQLWLDVRRDCRDPVVLHNVIRHLGVPKKKLAVSTQSMGDDRYLWKIPMRLTN